MSPDYVPLFTTGMGIVVLALACRMIGWISVTTTYGLLAVSQIAVCVAGFVTGNTVAVSISGAAAGYLAWQWWNGGGGDKTKRRIRQFAGQFNGVRRTAPVGSE
jgi:hypothetical protein